MWIKKEPSEITQLFILKFLKILFISIIIIVPLLFFADIVSFHRYGQRYFWPWRTIFGKIPIYLIISCAAGLIIFILKNIRPKTVMCELCYQITPYMKNKHCKCGGYNIRIEYMKPIEVNNAALFKR
jgi:hypothetical protein